jgi:hypothetical protein
MYFLSAHVIIRVTSSYGTVVKHVYFLTQCLAFCSTYEHSCAYDLGKINATKLFTVPRLIIFIRISFNTSENVSS